VQPLSGYCWPVPALDRVRATARRIAKVDDERAELVGRRDAEIAAAFEEGATWAQVQEASGLTARAVQKALERHRAAQG